MDVKGLIEAIGEVADTKGLSQEVVVNALREAIIAAYTKNIGGNVTDMAQADVRCDIDVEKGIIDLRQVKTVRDEVTDDFVEIETEEANEGLKKAKYKDGDEFVIPATVEELSKATAMGVKSNLRAKLAEAERIALYEIYKDHIGEMITGTVEKADDRLITINIGRTNVELTRKELIGEETFNTGDNIKVYIEEVRSADKPADGSRDNKPKGPQIQATRSSEGFLKRLFEEEIHEIYDGTVVIKGIARMAGIRSKVAVVSTNEDVDATGACIGASGSRIQRIVAQLGNAKDREKIDIVNYSANKGQYIIESLRPATVIGVQLYDIAEGENMPRALAVVKDGTINLAIGRRNANHKLANRLTGYIIEILEESQAKEAGREYIAAEEWIKQANEEKAIASKEAYLAKSQAEASKRAEAYAAKKEAAKANVSEADFPAEAANPAAAALEIARAEQEAKRAMEARAAQRKAFVIPTHDDIEETVSEENNGVNENIETPVVEEPSKPTFVKTTTTLDDLEKELENHKEKTVKPAKSFKKPRKITEEEVAKPSEAKVAAAKPAPEVMPIYTEEELAEIEKEELGPDGEFADEVNEDVDYAEFDQYYDEEK